MFTVPLANDERTRSLVGRMGVLPSGTAENGEYHHGQAFAHRFRLDVPGQADRVWRQFQPMMSALRDESVGGPFETPCTSYVSDPADPHFGQGMYFGLSGSVDWIVEIFQRMAGVELALHDPDLPDVCVEPELPAQLGDQMTFRRVVHVAEGPGRYRQVPLTVIIRRRGGTRRPLPPRVRINGRRADEAVVESLAGVKKVRIEIDRVYED
jgi:hypothetical protein